MAQMSAPPYVPYFLIFIPAVLTYLCGHALIRYDIIEGFVGGYAAMLVRMFRLIC
jgi:hypothetical protein